MRTSLGLTIGAMGLLGMLLAFVTGEIYRRVAIESHRATLADLVEIKINDLIKDAVTRAGDLGLGLQHKLNLADMVKQRDADALQRTLDSQFHQYFVTAGVIKLKHLAVFDRDMALLVASTEGRGLYVTGHDQCSTLLAAAKKRDGVARHQTLHEICAGPSDAVIGVLVPVGGLKVAGYLFVVLDLAFGLQGIEPALGMPVKIVKPTGAIAYQAATWPQSAVPFDTLVVDYDVRDPAGGQAVRVEVIANVKLFYDGLRSTRTNVLLIASLATFFALFVSSLMLQRTTLSPLQILTRQLQLLRTDKKYLGEHVSVGGNAEIQGLANDFNKMTTELKTLYSKMETIAYTDPVTQLANRVRFHDVLQAHSEHNRRSNAPFALVIVDVQRFKAVNESLGHEVGDQLLVQIGARLERVLRRTDVAARVDEESLRILNERGHSVARLGGDEFALLLPNVATREQASVVAGKITTAMGKPFILNGSPYEIGASMGVVLAPEHGTDAGTLLRRADVAVAEAKKRQLEHYVYDDANDQHRLFQLMMEKDLRAAIAGDGLELHFQPQLAMTTRCLWGVEALVRWQHPEKGFMAPDKFIPLAEQTGLIHPLTVWVLNAAVAFCADMQRAGCHFRVSVNLSAHSLREKDLPAMVGEALSRVGLAPHYLVLEITESAVMADPDQALQLLAELDALGLSLSIDDFGTGYSSMSYLRRLPVDEIKIDRSFVKDLAGQSSDEVIVRSVIDLAHNMGLKSVAEGVETDAAWNILNDLGCDVAQGYFMGRPMRAQAFRDWVAANANVWTVQKTPLDALERGREK